MDTGGGDTATLTEAHITSPSHTQRSVHNSIMLLQYWKAHFQSHFTQMHPVAVFT